MVSQYIPDCLGIRYVEQDGLELTEIHLLLLPEFWDLKCLSPPPPHTIYLLMLSPPRYFHYFR